MTALQINVAGLLKETAGAAREYPVNAPPGELAGLLEDARVVSPVRGQARIMRTQQSVFVRGRLQTTLAVECSRCLDETVLPVRFDVEAEYFPEVDINTGKGLPRPNDDLAFTINQSHEVDLREAVRQHLLLELPMSQVCREDCKGLCSRCGVDLNIGKCLCEPELLDDRLTPLKALLDGKAGAAG